MKQLPFDSSQKQDALDKWQKLIDNQPWTPLFPYPYCCLCFEKLTVDNIAENEKGLIDVCLECKDL